MTPFLQQVAWHYLESSFKEDLVFIFPNRRSLVFFRKYFGEAVCNAAFLPDSSILEPRMLTVSDFFSRATGKSTMDKVSLLVDLYECYSKLDKSGETLDNFIYWGDVILSDFDDVDKYLVNAADLYTDIADFKSMKDDFSYLTEEQRAAIARLASHFSTGEVIGVKRNFLTIWEIMLPLYRDFRAVLLSKGTAYEGMLYRDLADRLKSESVSDILGPVFGRGARYVFVGLNALNECERTVMDRMRDAGLAEFCWDFSGDMITDPKNISSHFMAGNLARYPNAFKPDPEGVGKPGIHVISVPSATGQAKILPEILTDVPAEERGLDFAVVLPDESMLMTVLNSIPAGKDVPGSVDSINVTMGYPLSSSEFHAFMRDVLALQMHIRYKDGKCFFYHKQVNSLFSSGILKQVMGEDERTIAADIKGKAKYYIPQEDFGSGALFSLIFSPVDKDMSMADESQIRALAGYQLDVISAVASRLGEGSDLHLECARRYYRAVNVLKDKDLRINPQTWGHLVAQTMNSVSVPFEGEPLGGLQVMGPLETRALDFKRLVIMNASEGVFPRRSVSSSFIPPEMRTAFGLPAYEYQDAVWAYYFYRMISRAQEVWMIYDSRTEGLNSGEESRYIKQLRYLYPDKCVFDECVAKAGVSNPVSDEAIPKTEEDIEKIRNGVLSASSVQKYISCPASFYYYAVKGLKTDNEVHENLDPGMLGNVCHDTLQALYSGEEAMKREDFFDKRDKRSNWENSPHLDVITKEYLEGWKLRKDEIRAKVMSVIKSQIHGIEVTGRNLVSADIAMSYIMQVIDLDIKLIESHGPIRILGLEKAYPPVEICGHRFFGYIDRLDSFADGMIRIVDYKTGSDNPAVLAVDEPEKLAAQLFSASTAHAVKAAFQFYVYDKFVMSDSRWAGREIYNSMYALSDIFTGSVTVNPVSAGFMDAVDGRLGRLIAEMEDPDVPFSRTTDRKTCRYCDYRLLCGKSPEKR